MPIKAIFFCKEQFPKCENFKLIWQKTFGVVIFMEVMLLNMAQLAFHAATAAVGYKAFIEHMECSPTIYTFLMASGATNALCFFHALVTARSSAHAAPPLLTVATLAAGLRAAMVAGSAWPFDQCGAIPAMATYATVIVQSTSLVLAIFRILSVALACLMLVLLAGGILSATNVGKLGLLSGLAKLGRPEFLPHELDLASLALGWKYN